MTATGASTGPDPVACPFVALDDNRDARSGQPDPRHRCFAEPVPAPRSIEHQERFCLSPNFAACPIFAEWAVRAAAHPVAGSERAAVAAVADPAPELWVERIDKPHTGTERWPDSMDPAIPAAAAAVVADAAAESENADEEQLAAFAPAPTDSGGSGTPAIQGVVSDEPALSPAAMPVEPGGAADDDERGFDPAPLPTFLTARSPRTRAAGATQPVDAPHVSPTWENDPRRAAQAQEERSRDGTFSRLLTLAAVVIILALGVATVLIVPGLLSGGLGQTTRPSSVAAPSRLATALASAVAVVASPSAEPTIVPASGTPVPVATPEPSLRTYKVQPGDSLRRIARQFGVSVTDILAANPGIPNADHVEVGQRLVIPNP